MLCAKLTDFLQCEAREVQVLHFDLLTNNDSCLCDTQITLASSASYFRKAFQNTFPVLVISAVGKNGYGHTFE